MDKFKADFNDSFEAICTNAEGASEALQQGYALLEEVGDDLRPAARRKLEAAVNKLEAAMAASRRTHGLLESG